MKNGKPVKREPNQGLHEAGKGLLLIFAVVIVLALAAEFCKWLGRLF